MRKYKKIANIFYLCSLVFFVLAALNFTGASDIKGAIIYVCIGFVLFGSGSLLTKKDKKDDSSQK